MSKSKVHFARYETAKQDLFIAMRALAQPGAAINEADFASVENDLDDIVANIVAAEAPKSCIVRNRSRREIDRERRIAAIPRNRPAKPYFVLVERLTKASPWGVQFGAYDRDDVEAELQDRRDHCARAGNLKIITTTSDARSIETAVAQLNRS